MKMNTFEALLRSVRWPLAVGWLAMGLLPLAGHAQAPAPATSPAPAPAASAPLAAAPQVALRSGTFKAVEGDVAVVRDRSRSVPAPGAALQPGDRIATGPASSTVITLRDGTVLTVGPNSVVDLSRFAFEPTTQRGNFLLDLLEGSVRVVTGVLARVNPDLFKVNTPTSVVGVRGTDFIVEAEPNPAVRKALP